MSLLYLMVTVPLDQELGRALADVDSDSPLFVDALGDQGRELESGPNHVKLDTTTRLWPHQPSTPGFLGSGPVRKTARMDHAWRPYSPSSTAEISGSPRWEYWSEFLSCRPCRSPRVGGSQQQKRGDYGACPGGAIGRRGVCRFLRARRSCLAAGIAVLLSLCAVGLAPLTFSNKQEILQLSTAFDELKRDQDDVRRLSATVDVLKRDLVNELNRTATLEQRLHVIEKTLPSCPEGYIIWREICYKAFNTPESFSDAAAACRADGGTLAMPRDADTNAFLISLYNSVRDDCPFWFGLHDQREEGRFEWVDGSALGPYNSWGQGRPDNNEGNQDCVVYSGLKFEKDKWNDEECHKMFRFICQAAPVFCPSWYIIWRGTCYKAFNTVETFSDAAAACRADGGTLAMPRDAETNAFLISLYKFVTKDCPFWFGLHDQREEGRFEWVDGSALGPYNSWGQGRPDNNEGNQDCVVYSGLKFEKDKWNDEECHKTFRFICQAAPVEMYEQAEPVRSPFSGPDSRQISGPPPQPRPVRQREVHAGVSATATALLTSSGKTRTRLHTRTKMSMGRNVTQRLQTARIRVERAAAVVSVVTRPSDVQQQTGIHRRVGGSRSQTLSLQSALSIMVPEISQLSTIVKRDQDNMRQLFTTVDALKSDQDTLKRDQDGMSTAVDALKRDQDDMSTAVDALKRDQDGMSTAVDALECDQDDMSTAVDALKRDQDGMSTAVDALECDQDGMSTAVDALKRDQDDMSTAVDALKRDQDRVFRRGLLSLGASLSPRLPVLGDLPLLPTAVYQSAVSDLTFSDIEMDQMTLSWRASDDVRGYRLRYRHAGASYQDLSPPPAPDGTQATVRGLWADTEYNFTLTAFGEDDEEIGEISGTETTAEVIVNVDCHQDHMSATFPRKALIGVDVDTLHLSDDTCRATYTETEVTLRTGLQECGTTQESSDDKLIFSNEAFGSPVVHDNGAVRGATFRKSFQCEFVSQFVISQEQNILFNIPSPRVQVVNAENQFTFEMHMFPSVDFAETYKSADYPVHVSPSDQLHFGLSVNSPLNNLELFALHCLATPSDDPEASPSVNIIQDGHSLCDVRQKCDIDTTLQLNNARSGDMASYYSIQSFTFPNVDDPSLVYIHCTMVVCFKDDPDSRCSEGCIPATRRRRAVSDMSEARERRASETDETVTISQGPLKVVRGEKQASAVPTVGIAVGTAAGIAGVLLMVAAVFLVRKRRRRDVKEQAEDRVGFDNYSFELWGKGKAANATPKPE
ncbi:hypothetical protein Bbelb_415780 [Branchiostoma belcheri]|nr:hypothetical protein Bbelb_415780 [Branchiostoma belcheri]